MTNSKKDEQKKNDSVQASKTDSKNQENKPSAVGKKNDATDAEVKSTQANLEETKKAVYSVGEVGSSEFQDQVKIIEGLELLITEKKDKLFILQGLTKPIPRAQKKLGKKSPLTAANRKAARLEIKHLNKEIFSLEENKRTAMEYLGKMVNSGRESIDLQLVREHSVSQYYLSRNKNSILKNVLKTINKVYSDSESTADDREQVNALVRASRETGAKALRTFQAMFIEFLRSYKQELAILCNGKEWFKKEATTKVKKALSNWNPRSGELNF